LWQRNGRIDRTLQRAPEVYCHYFVLADREEDRVLDVLVRKTEEIRKTLGSLPPVVVGRLNELLAKGINPTAIQEVIDQIRIALVTGHRERCSSVGQKVSVGVVQGCFAHGGVSLRRRLR
jgi:hypothetical protein